MQKRYVHGCIMGSSSTTCAYGTRPCIGVLVLPCHDVVDVAYWRWYDDMSHANFEEEGPDTVQVSFLLAVGFEPTAMQGNKVCVSAADIQCINQ